MIRDIKSEGKSTENEEIAIMVIGSGLKRLEHNKLKIDLWLG